MGREILEGIKNIDIKQVKINLASGQYGNESNPDYKLVKNYIEEKELEENRQITKEGLKISRDNARSTRNLAWATWGLVLVTALLVLASFIKK